MIQWQWREFAQLSATDVYAMLALRSEIFVVEQQCVYQDIDGLDPLAWHLLAWQEFDGKPRLVAYLRVLPQGVKFTEMSLGRVVSHSVVRGTGIGRALLTQALQQIEQHFHGQAIRISAQLYLQQFYEDFGFHTCSSVYDEDGIAHIEMLRPATK
jgi:ElaA protein